MLGSRTNLHVIQGGSVIGVRYCTKIILPFVRLFRRAVDPDFDFMGNNATPHHVVAAVELLESKDI